MSTLRRTIVIGVALAATVSPSLDARERVSGRAEAPTSAAEAIRASVLARLGGDVVVTVLSTGIADQSLAFTEARPDPTARLGAPIRFTLLRAGAMPLHTVAEVRVIATYLTATRAIARNQAVADDDVVEVRAEVRAVPLRPLPGRRDVRGARALRPIAVGATILPGWVVGRRAVEPGDRVTVVAVTGAVEVTAELVAADGGHVGQLIRVVNPDTRRYLAGTHRASRCGRGEAMSPLSARVRLTAVAAGLTVSLLVPALASAQAGKAYDELYERYLAAARTAPAAPRLWIGDLTGDQVARRMNDLVTIRVQESMNAVGTADSNIGKTSSADVSLPGKGATVLSKFLPASSDTKFNGSGSTSRSTGTDSHAHGARRRGPAERGPGGRRGARARHQWGPAARRADRRHSYRGCPARQRGALGQGRPVADSRAQPGPDQGQPVAGLADPCAQQDLLIEQVESSMSVWMIRRSLLPSLVVLGLAAVTVPTSANSRLKDIVTLQGQSTAPLIGYGLVVGLNKSGDKRQTIFTAQSLANLLQKFGLSVPAEQMKVENIAGVLVTAEISPFSRTGARLDVTASSTGDARSLQGGTLLPTSLHGPNGEVIALAQGPLSIGGFGGGGGGTSVQVNHLTVGRIPSGAIVQQALAQVAVAAGPLMFALRDPDFVTAARVAQAINQHLGTQAARALDPGNVALEVPARFRDAVPQLMAELEGLSVTTDSVARVVINERTGTVVVGGNVQLAAAAVAHGNLSVRITTKFQVSQPAPFSGGETQVVPQQQVDVREGTAKLVTLEEGVTLEAVTSALNLLGASPRDIIAIMQALKAAGALRAEIVIL